MQHMSEPVDYIDLTVDSPVERRLRSLNRNRENIDNNGSKPRKHSKRRQVEPHDLNGRTLDEDTNKNLKPTEIIDLDNSGSTPVKQKGICYVNDSNQENLVVLKCPICYDKLSSEMKPMSTRCGHIFCFQCLEQVLQTIKKCPTCKRAIRMQNCTRLYF